MYHGQKEGYSYEMKFSLAFSPCPNDTFMMHGIMSGEVCDDGLELDISLLDIQELNTAMRDGRFDFCKVSSVAAMKCLDQYELCSVGAALGYGVGPLLLRRPGAGTIGDRARVLCPGEATTAHALFRSFYPHVGSVEQTVFSDIMPALCRGDADFGVVIHEGRFTYGSFGLELVADLGALWEERWKLPLPLGCLVAHRRVSEPTRKIFESLVKKSIECSYQRREAAFRTMQQYAQELDEKAIWSHVELYVNQWSLDLGDTGREAFKALGSLYTMSQ